MGRTVAMSGRSLKWLTIIVDRDGVGAKQEHITTSASICVAASVTDGGCEKI